ncbi:MAG: three-Cys-motif partner protein TcmP [Anaerolineales bacterium]|nr:three-Cys-motif partner protein TcmP [Anaerolineales bacterium]
MTQHDFGGDWTNEKLERVRKYLSAYTTIFAKNPRAQKLNPIYVDAFAGTGYRTVPHAADVPSLLLPELADTDNEAFLKGSARIALEIDPPFKRYLFIEQNPEYAAELKTLKIEYPHHAPHIHVINADANIYLMNWCKQMAWNDRAVVFLDPYGMQVEWALIQEIAKTQKIDLWILFPLGVAINRLLTKSGPPPAGWAQALDRIFGTNDWQEAFYPQKKVLTLFGEVDTQSKQASLDQIAQYFVKRLRTVFAAVAEKPLPLFNSKNCPLYLLCFATGNLRNAKTAINIAQDILRR